MKKALYLSAATALLFAVIFAGCGVQEISQDYATISAPKNLKATAQPGFNLITWEASKDAEGGYEVYRKDAVTGEVKNITPTGKLYVADKVGLENELVGGRKYTYRVISKSGGDLPLRNGEASVDVTATIPAQGDASVVAAPAATDISFTPTSDGTQLEVTWLGNENFSYSASYAYNDGTPGTAPFEFTGSVTGTSLKRLSFPLVGGPTTVKITAQWDRDDYYKSAEASKTETVVSSILPDVSSFSVTTAESGIYTIQWNAITGATGYDIWKAEILNNPVSGGGNLTGMTLGAWASIATASATIDGSQYTLVESGVDVSKSYLYGIIAKNTDAKSSLKTVSTTAILSPSLSITSFNITQLSDANGKPQLKIEVNVANGETVTKLERAEAVYESTTASTPKSVGAYTSLAVGASANGNYVWLDKPAIRASYVYKMTITKNGLSKDILDSYKSGAYTPFLGNSITLTASAATVPANYSSMSIKFSNYSSYRDDIKADIWQMETDASGNPIDAATQWVKIAPDVTYATLSSTAGYIQSGLAPAKYYKYRVELTSTEGNVTKTLFNTIATTSAAHPSIAQP
ncbi:MAG: hypothetical protein LBL45_11245 [Treponema sp.]|jgi:hypothetical protein|nr:hypothetical protein [Treponema sp.]